MADRESSGDGDSDEQTGAPSGKEQEIDTREGQLGEKKPQIRRGEAGMQATL